MVGSVKSLSVMPRVVVESPYAGEIERNVAYARLCLLDCLRREEAPYASHLLLPQVLDDADPDARAFGMLAGFIWGEAADLVAVYTDHGISRGMAEGIARAATLGIPIEYRTLPRT